MLARKKCIPCEGKIKPLGAAAAKKHLAEVPGWAFTSGKKAIKRRFKFKNFVGALKFVNKVGAAAEKEGHHPDVTFGWGYAEFQLSTHSIGGLHENDFIMASKINALWDAI